MISSWGKCAAISSGVGGGIGPVASPSWVGCIAPIMRQRGHSPTMAWAGSSAPQRGHFGPVDVAVLILNHDVPAAKVYRRFLTAERHEQGLHLFLHHGLVI